MRAALYYRCPVLSVDCSLMFRFILLICLLLFVYSSYSVDVSLQHANS